METHPKNQFTMLSKFPEGQSGFNLIIFHAFFINKIKTSSYRVKTETLSELFFSFNTQLKRKKIDNFILRSLIFILLLPEFFLFCFIF